MTSSLLQLLACAVGLGASCEEAPPFDCAAGGVVQTARDLETLGTCTDVAGNLILRVDVDGSQRNFDQLVRVDGHLHLIGNEPLRTLDSFSELKTVGKDLVIERNSNLGSLSLPTIESVSGKLIIRANPLLTEISIPKLVNVGTLKIEDNHGLSSFAFTETLIVSGDVNFTCNGAPTRPEDPPDVTMLFAAQLDEERVGGSTRIVGPGNCSFSSEEG